MLTAAGAVEVLAPRVNDKRVDETTGERRRFASAILPPWCRKSPKINEVLPLLYLHGLSSQDFVSRSMRRVVTTGVLPVLNSTTTASSGRPSRTAP